MHIHLAPSLSSGESLFITIHSFLPLDKILTNYLFEFIAP